MSRTPRCSVIIPTYNRARLLGATLDSLTRQRIPPDEFEVLVVDDGSSDDTRQVAAGYADRIDVRYFAQPDEGFRVARARNVGIAHARGPVCVFVDSGVLLHSGCLAAHLSSHDASPVPVAANGLVYCFNKDNEDAALIRQAIDLGNPDATIERLQEQRRWLDVRERFYQRHGDEYTAVPAPWVMFWTCNASVRTAQLRELGLFDEWFRSWGGEDIELGYRLYLDGARFLVNRDASAIHHPHDKSFQANMASMAGNSRYIARKHRTPITELFGTMQVNIFALNDVIRERGMPDCRQYRAGADSAPHGASLPR